MKKLAVLLVTVAWLGGGAADVRGEEKVLTGTISDSLCGASHAEKQKSKISDRDCVIACLGYSTENSPKLVVVAKGGQIYQIANQKFAGLIRHAGEALVITGDVNGTTMTITKIEVVAKP